MQYVLKTGAESSNFGKINSIKYPNYLDLIYQNQSLIIRCPSYVQTRYSASTGSQYYDWEEETIIALIKNILINENNINNIKYLKRSTNNNHFQELYNLLFRSQETITKDIFTQIMSSKDLFWNYYQKPSFINYNNVETKYNNLNIVETSPYLIYEDNSNDIIYHSVLTALKNKIHETCENTDISNTTQSSLIKNLYHENIYKTLKSFFDTYLNTMLTIILEEVEDNHFKTLLLNERENEEEINLQNLKNSNVKINLSFSSVPTFNKNYYYIRVDNGEKFLQNIHDELINNENNFISSLQDILTKDIIYVDADFTGNYTGKTKKEVIPLLFDIDNVDIDKYKTIFNENINNIEKLAQLRENKNTNVSDITYIVNSEVKKVNNELEFNSYNNQSYLVLSSVFEIVSAINASSTAVFIGDQNSDSEVIKKSEGIFNYDNSSNLKPFVKINDQYIIDTSDHWNPELTYYYPVQKPRTVQKIPPLSFSSRGMHHQYVTIYPTNNENNDINVLKLMLSLSVLKFTLKNFGDYELVSYFPIALKNGTTKNELGTISFTPVVITGANSVRYSTIGETEYERNPYVLQASKLNADNRTGFTMTNLQNYPGYESDRWTIFYSTNFMEDKVSNFLPNLGESNKNNNTQLIKPLQNSSLGSNDSFVFDACQSPVLQPIRVYIPEAPNYGVMYWHKELDLEEGNKWIPYWSQPIWVYEDNYPSTTINQWNGKDITTDEDSGTILASAFAAGKKEKDNTFTGVMLGDWGRTDTDRAITKQTGIFGFNHGKMSYAFKDDGTGFIGKDGRGRIIFDGNQSTIVSNNWYGKQPSGMFLDIDDGIIQLQSDPMTLVEYITTQGFEIFSPQFYYIHCDQQGENQQQILLTNENFRKENNGSWQLIENNYTGYYIGLNNNNESNVVNDLNQCVDMILSDKMFNTYKPLISDLTNPSKIDLLAFFYNKFYLNASIFVCINNNGNNSNNSNYDILTGLYWSNIQERPRINNSLYIPSSTGKQRYITLSSAESLYPLAIGTEQARSQRDFKVTWDGHAFLKNATVKGTITGSDIIGSNITGSLIEANLFKGDAGTIGGWQITKSGLVSSSAKTLLLHDKGIHTNIITFVDATYKFRPYSELKAEYDNNHNIETEVTEPTPLGTIGYGIGSDTIRNTNLLLIRSLTEDGLAIETVNGNIRIDAGVRREENGSPRGSIYIGPESGKGYISFQNIPAENQYGIYARFA